jgi:hypothetical protein
MPATTPRPPSSDQVAAFDRNAWPRSIGIPGRNRRNPHFALGEAYQFDWSHEIVLLNGVTVTVKAAHVRLCHSRMLFVRAYSKPIPMTYGASAQSRSGRSAPSCGTGCLLPPTRWTTAHWKSRPSRLKQ